LIFVTVGGQLPFDRLIRCVDAFAAHAGTELFAQIGAGEYTPQHMRWERFLSPARFRETAQACEAIVAHAGIGTILTALELRRPLLVFPRRAEHREHRNDHQLATARHFSSRGHLLCAFDEAELEALLPRLRAQAPGAPPAPPAPELLARLRAFAFQD
jgi:UDP-N-acetylglucosamine transferase subunit ALG13